MTITDIVFVVLSELRALFQDMISSPSPAVMPGQELARLTLISSSNEAAIRRRSLIAGSRPGLGEIHGMPVLGPLGPPSNVNMEDTTENTPPRETNSDVDSESTLVTKTGQMDNTIEKSENKENFIPQSSQVDVKMQDDNQEDKNAPAPSQEPVHEPITPPSRPPPVPPRPVPQIDQQQQIREEVELGAQQDVTEVINNVLFQTQCAIKPLGIDTDGEQLDVVTE